MRPRLTDTDRNLLFPRPPVLSATRVSLTNRRSQVSPAHRVSARRLRGCLPKRVTSSWDIHPIARFVVSSIVGAIRTESSVPGYIRTNLTFATRARGDKGRQHMNRLTHRAGQCGNDSESETHQGAFLTEQIGSAFTKGKVARRSFMKRLALSGAALMPASHALADKGGGKKPKGASISNGDAAILRLRRSWNGSLAAIHRVRGCRQPVHRRARNH